MKQPVIDQIYESWEWKLREKLEDANDVVRRIHKECIQFGVKPTTYEAYMKEKLAKLLQDIGDGD
jgi:hypothetical protein